MMPRVHVDDIQRTVWSVRDLDRPEAFVRRCQELSPFWYTLRARSVGPSSLSTIRLTTFAARLRDEDIPVEHPPAADRLDTPPAWGPM